MPEKLGAKDRNKFHSTITDLIEHIPCDDCKSHARAYMKDNKPLYKSNQQAFDYYCQFHNHINESQGKPVQDCNTIWAQKDKPCTDCSTTTQAIKNNTDNKIDGGNNCSNSHSNPEIPQRNCSATPLGEVDKDIDKNENNQKSDTNVNTNPKQALSVDHFLNQSLKTSLEDYKNVSTRMFQKMCDNARVPMPQLIFAEQTQCSNPESSCTHFPVDKKSGKLSNEAPTKVYLNVNQYSPRSVIHEALHYISKVKGIDVLTKSHEDEITKRAREIMARDFPMTFQTKGVNVNVTPYQSLVHDHDEGYSREEVNDEITPASVDPMKHFKERSRQRLDGFTSNLPYYSRYYHKAKKHKKEQPSPQVVSTMTYSDGRPVYPQVPIQQAPPEPPEKESASEGFVSMLDPIFAPFGDALGMKARDVNLAHTPALLANGGIVLVESNFNKFGSMFISLLSSLVTLAAGTLSKDNLGYTDKKLLVGLGGALFWSGALRYIANPKISDEVVAQAQEFGNSLATGDINAMAASFSAEKPKEIEKDPLMKGAREVPVGSIPDLRGPISRPVGGTERLVGRGRASEYDDLNDPYTFNEDVGSAQGSFKRPSWFPSL